MASSTRERRSWKQATVKNDAIVSWGACAKSESKRRTNLQTQFQGGKLGPEKHVETILLNEASFEAGTSVSESLFIVLLFNAQ